MKYIVLFGRIIFSLLFLLTITFHFRKFTFDYAESQGLPVPAFFVPLAGVLAIGGGLSIAFGYKARAGAWLIVMFLVPVTILMHAFWKESDPTQMQMQLTAFIKNSAMLGGAFLISYFGAGPLSFDEKKRLNSLSGEIVSSARTNTGEKYSKDWKKRSFANQVNIDGLRLEHFWQSAENPSEVVFMFKATDVDVAKRLIKKNRVQFPRKKRKFISSVPIFIGEKSS
jgi:putative oxidoreductase